jgi:HAD superfamily hydrolase (TIGR01450 family)
MAKAIVFDLDGVVYRGAEGIPGVAAEISRLQKKMAVLFLTNNATKSRIEYVRHLARFGIHSDIKDVMTASYGCARYIEEKYGRDKKVFVIGESGLQFELEGEAGADLVDEGAELVVVGLDRYITYAKLELGLRNLHNGAKFILANNDPTLPREMGFSPGSGAIAAALSFAAGRQPDVVVGKPSIYLIKKLLQMHKLKPSDAIFVGDRLDIDIRMANAAGMKSVLVLTGVSGKADVKKAPKSDRPGKVIASAADIGKALGV